MCHRPFGNLRRQREAFRVFVREKAQGVNRLRRALDVHGPGVVVIITRSTGRLKEGLDKVSVTVTEVLLERIIPRGFNVTFYAVEVVAGVEIIDPMIFRLLAVPPRTIRQLTMAAVAHCLPRDFQKLGVAGMFPRAGE